ncbi:MAG: Spi family protease inhibitor [Duncaniella sp.]|nr:Spi family protease inhibitor [Muribaculum sp.]MCM1254857.1 Spi family protease inhibitor [Duncaniella sp.]
MVKSRNAESPLITEIYPVKANEQISSRSADAENGDIVYVANFANEQGYAILAADDRISEKVIAVTESGNMNPQIMRSSGNDREEDEDIRHIFDNYPTTEPGFFTIDGCGDELFMNPNTVSLYDENEDDTLIGDFDEDDDTGAEDENGNPILTNQSDKSLMEYIAGLCIDYAINEINGDGNGSDDGGTSDEDDDDPNGGDPQVPGSGDTGNFMQALLLSQIK